MRSGTFIASCAAVVAIVASASQAVAQCSSCGRQGPSGRLGQFGSYDPHRVKIFRGGSLEQIPDEEEVAPKAEPEVARRPTYPSAPTVKSSVRRASATVPSASPGATSPKIFEVQAAEALPDRGAVPSSRRAIARQGDGAPPPDAFRMKQDPRAAQPPQVDPEEPAPAPAKFDPSKGRIPKYRYSGSTFPYYFGRSYLNFPHFEQWHQPATDALRRERKSRFLNTFFEPLMDFTHGVQVEEKAPAEDPAVAEEEGSGVKRVGYR